ncbi:hypothetical protein RJ639_030659 [Escallonia herrerae]|uniref:Retrovirus-related Pol polyprotein from transposon RE1 n=1 Tax=Escallonia herrerae TaxID=1293975 RepID=A0AA88X3J2_9ASTE|nr:hypothetical protein RJ639_030659 [Escallonia herrerae]
MVKTAMTGAWRSLDSSETTSSTPGGILRPTMAHGGDHLSQLSFQLSSHKLTKKNYLEWAQSVKLAIDGRGKLGHLTGDVRQPAAGDPSLSSWRSENSLIIAWLINSIEPTIGKPYLFHPTTKDVWEVVRETYSDVENSSQIFDLKTKLWKSKQGEHEVTIYYNEIVSLWQELDQCYNDEWDCPSDSVKVMKKEWNKKIKIADGSLSAIVGTGSIVLSPSITLHNVLHIPKLSCNLLSISKLTNDLKCQANFYSTQCEFQEMRENKDEDSEFFDSQPTVSPGNITMANGPNFLINTELSGLNNEKLDPKSIGLSHDIDGNKNGGSTGTKELVYSRRKQIQRNETDASQYYQDSVPQTIQNSIEATGDTHTNPIHLNLPSSESSQPGSSISNLDKPIAHPKVYVDDIILTGDDIVEMERLKQCLASEFEIKDLGSLKFFLRMEIARSRKGIAVSQMKYVLDLIKETGMSECRPVETPIDPNQKLGDNKGDPVNTSRYQKLVGKLIYLSHTRPDIAFAISLVSQFMHSPHEEHLEAIYRILRYLKSSPGKRLFFRNNEQRNLKAYTDADWAGSITDRKSTSGYCTFVWGNLVTWRSKKQSVVARSSAEVEYRAMAHGICEMMWLKRVLEELRRPVTMPMKLYSDNKVAINIANNPVQHDITKHVEIDKHFIKEKIEAGTVYMPFVPTSQQVAGNDCLRLTMSFLLAS